MKRMYLIAEYCEGPFYMGWHLYLRDNYGRHQRNADGEWGWVRRLTGWPFKGGCIDMFLQSLGIRIKGDGTCDDDGVAEIARRFPIPRQRIGRRPRGCIAVDLSEEGMQLADDQPFKKENTLTRE